MWELYAVYRCMSYGGAGGSPRDGRDTVYLVSDDREEGSYSGGVAEGNGTAGLWMRYLSRRLPVEPEGSCGRKGGYAGAAGVSESGARVAGWNGCGRVQAMVQGLSDRTYAQEAAAPECGDRHGQQPGREVFVSARSVEHMRGPGSGRECGVGDRADPSP